MTVRKAMRPHILLFNLLLAGGLVGCGSEPAPQMAAPETVRGVEWTTVAPVMVPDVFEVVGTVRAAQTSQVASQLLAEIAEIRVQEGDAVRRGQVLAVLEEAQPRAGLEKARAALAAAEKELAAANADYELAAATLRRYQTLFERKSVSPQEFDEAKSRYEMTAARRESAEAAREQAQAALEQAKVTLSHTRLRAPFDGRVTDKRADPGTLATPGMVLLVVEDTGHFRIDVSVDESHIDAVREGQSVQVVLDALKVELTGRVRQIVPTADPASRSFLVKVELPSHPRLRSGLFGRARFSRGEREGLLVPSTAIRRRGQLEGVFVVEEDGIARLRYVTLGKSFDSRVEILSGLTAGERIVVAPGERQLAGKRIEE